MGRPGLLILGVGNVLMRDDGVGPRLAEALEHDAGLPGNTRVVDGGTLGLALLPLLDGAATVLLLDALDTGALPGTVTVLVGADCEGALGQRLSAHQVGAGDLLVAARLNGFEGGLAMVGVQPSDVSPGVELSPPVASSFAAALGAILATAWALSGRSGAC